MKHLGETLSSRLRFLYKHPPNLDNTRPVCVYIKPHLFDDAVVDVVVPAQQKNRQNSRIDKPVGGGEGSRFININEEKKSQQARENYSI